MTRAPPHASRAVGQYGFGHLALLTALEGDLSGGEPDVEGVCPRWASPPPDTFSGL